ncbi:hypothetical protein ACFSY7_03180 [Kurthia populi]|uniref:Uncharacterized protein n=1 Tax=Kurthia populi TaxID=1562132 RepID=A0ABW5XWZ1_9BACL
MNLKIYGGSETAAANEIVFHVSADRTYIVTLKKEMSYQGFAVRANAYTFEICFMGNSGKIIVGPGHEVALAVKGCLREFIRYRTLQRTKTCGGTVASMTEVARANLNAYLDSASKTVIKGQTIAQEDAEVENALAFTAALEAAEDIARQHAINAALDARDEELFMTLTGGA